MSQRTRTVGDLAVIHHREERRAWLHELLTGHTGLLVLLAIVDTAVAVYLIGTPDATFATQPAWAGVFGIADTLHPLGWLLMFVGVSAWLGIAGIPWVARIGYLLALAPWGAIVASFFVAWMQTGIGFMTAVLAGMALTLHLASVGHFPSDPNRN